jgi:hypothetical protein
MPDEFKAIRVAKGLDVEELAGELTAASTEGYEWVGALQFRESGLVIMKRPASDAPDAEIGRDSGRGAG